MLSKKLILIGVVLLLGAMLAYSQTTPPALAPYPDVTKSQTAAGIDLVNYKSTVEANIATTFQLATTTQQTVETLGTHLNGLSDQSRAIQTLQQQLAADEAAITALQARITALEGKVTTAGTTLAKP